MNEEKIISRMAETGEAVVRLNIKDIHPFEGHPFRVLDDDELMQQTVDSVARFGVLNPVVVRPEGDGSYEMVSGHRRMRASELAGLETIPALVRSLTDDEAIILLVDSNLQRENLLPSERAWAYRMKMDAIKHQGKSLNSKENITSPQIGAKPAENNPPPQAEPETAKDSSMAVTSSPLETKLEEASNFKENEKNDTAKMAEEQGDSPPEERPDATAASMPVTSSQIETKLDNPLNSNENQKTDGEKSSMGIAPVQRPDASVISEVSTSVTSSQFGTKLNKPLNFKLSEKIRTDFLMSQQEGMSKNQIHRYIRLTELLPKLLDMVDKKELAFNAAVELSYLRKEEQELFLEAMDYAQATPSLSQAQRIKKLSQQGKCTQHALFTIMSEEKKSDLDSLTFKSDVLKKYFPKSYTPAQMEKVILKLLDQWQRHRQRENSR